MHMYWEVHLKGCQGMAMAQRGCKDAVAFGKMPEKSAHGANTLHSTKSCFCTVRLKLYTIRMSLPFLTKLYSAKFW